MGKQLLFTEDERYSCRPYDHVEEKDRPKAEAIKQCGHNDSALKWLHTVYLEPQEHALTCEEAMSHPVTIADAFKFYADFMRKRHAENPTYETQQLLTDARRGESICSMILLQRKNLKMILWDYAVILVAEKALKCWNDVLPYKNEPKQPQATDTAADQQGAEPVDSAPKEGTDDNRNPEIEELVKNHKAYRDWDFSVFKEIDSMTGTTYSDKVNVFCGIYSCSDKEKALNSVFRNYKRRPLSDGKIKPRRTRKKKV